MREQFTIYGPRSANHEYFGFVYLQGGIIGSAVTRSRPCLAAKCVVDSAEALRLMPRSAKVLGEWHTHPHGGSASLSREDVRGAYNNRHINCYLAFYSTPGGVIYTWNPKQMSVPVAMASRAPVGNYKEVQPPPQFTGPLTSTSSRSRYGDMKLSCIRGTSRPRATSAVSSAHPGARRSTRADGISGMSPTTRKRSRTSRSSARRSTLIAHSPAA